MSIEKTKLVFIGIPEKELKSIKKKWLSSNKNLKNFEFKEFDSILNAKLSKYVFNYLDNPNKLLLVVDYNVDKLKNMNPKKLENAIESVKFKFQQYNVNEFKAVIFSNNKIPQLFEGLPNIKKNEVLKLYDVINKYKSIKIKKINLKNLLIHLLNSNKNKHILSTSTVRHILGGLDRSILDFENKHNLSQKEKVKLFLSLKKKTLEKDIISIYHQNNASKRELNNLMNVYKEVNTNYNILHHGDKLNIKKVLEKYVPKSAINVSKKKPLFHFKKIKLR
jgi:hypothetical protein